jgi:hypothetical protein
MLAKENKTFPGGKFLRKYLQHIMQYIYPERETVLNTEQ